MRIQQQAFRVYADPKHFEETIRFYEDLQGVACERQRCSMTDPFISCIEFCFGWSA